MKQAIILTAIVMLFSINLYGSKKLNILPSVTVPQISINSVSPSSGSGSGFVSPLYSFSINCRGRVQVMHFIGEDWLGNSVLTDTLNAGTYTCTIPAITAGTHTFKFILISSELGSSLPVTVDYIVNTPNTPPAINLIQVVPANRNIDSSTPTVSIMVDQTCNVSFYDRHFNAAGELINEYLRETYAGVVAGQSYAYEYTGLSAGKHQLKIVASSGITGTTEKIIEGYFVKSLPKPIITSSMPANNTQWSNQSPSLTVNYYLSSSANITYYLNNIAVGTEYKDPGTHEYTYYNLTGGTNTVKIANSNEYSSNESYPLTHYVMTAANVSISKYTPESGTKSGTPLGVDVELNINSPGYGQLKATNTSTGEVQVKDFTSTIKGVLTVRLDLMPGTYRLSRTFTNSDNSVSNGNFAALYSVMPPPTITGCTRTFTAYEPSSITINYTVDQAGTAYYYLSGGQLQNDSLLVSEIKTAGTHSYSFTINKSGYYIIKVKYVGTTNGSTNYTYPGFSVLKPLKFQIMPQNGTITANSNAVVYFQINQNIDNLSASIDGTVITPYPYNYSFTPQIDKDSIVFTNLVSPYWPQNKALIKKGRRLVRLSTQKGIQVKTDSLYINVTPYNASAEVESFYPESGSMQDSAYVTMKYRISEYEIRNYDAKLYLNNVLINSFATVSNASREVSFWLKKTGNNILRLEFGNDYAEGTMTCNYYINTPPRIVISSVSPPSGTVCDPTQVTLSYSVDKNVKASYYLDGALVGEIAVAAGQNSFVYPSISNASQNGYHNLTISCIDESNNTTATTSVNYLIETKPSITVLANPTWTENSITFGYNISQQGTVAYYDNGILVASVIKNSGNHSYTFQNQSEGIHNYKFTITNTKAYFSEATVSHYFEETPEVLAVTPSIQSNTQAPPLYLYVDATLKPLLNARQSMCIVSCYLDGKYMSAVETTSYAATVRLPGFAIMQSGTHEIKIVATVAGKTGFKTITYQTTTPPFIQNLIINTPSNTLASPANITASMRLNEPGTIIVYDNDQIAATFPNQTPSELLTYSVVLNGAGEHIIKYECLNAAGARQSETRRYSVLEEPLPKVIISNVSPASGTLTGSGKNVTITFSLDKSASLAICLNGRYVSRGVYEAGNHNYTFTNLFEGTNSFEILLESPSVVCAANYSYVINKAQSRPVFTDFVLDPRPEELRKAPGSVYIKYWINTTDAAVSIYDNGQKLNVQPTPWLDYYQLQIPLTAKGVHNLKFEAVNSSGSDIRQFTYTMQAPDNPLVAKIISTAPLSGTQTGYGTATLEFTNNKPDMVTFYDYLKQSDGSYKLKNCYSLYYSQYNPCTFSFTFPVLEAGEHWLKMVSTDQICTERDSIQYLVKPYPPPAVDITSITPDSGSEPAGAKNVTINYRITNTRPDPNSFYPIKIYIYKNSIPIDSLLNPQEGIDYSVLIPNVSPGFHKFKISAHNQFGKSEDNILEYKVTGPPAINLLPITPLSGTRVNSNGMLSAEISCSVIGTGSLTVYKKPKSSTLNTGEVIFTKIISTDQLVTFSNEVLEGEWTFKAVMTYKGANNQDLTIESDPIDYKVDSPLAPPIITFSKDIQNNMLKEGMNLTCSYSVDRDAEINIIVTRDGSESPVLQRSMLVKAAIVNVFSLPALVADRYSIKIEAIDSYGTGKKEDSFDVKGALPRPMLIVNQSDILPASGSLNNTNPLLLVKFRQNPGVFNDNSKLNISVYVDNNPAPVYQKYDVESSYDPTSSDNLRWQNIQIENLAQKKTYTFRVVVENGEGITEQAILDYDVYPVGTPLVEINSISVSDDGLNATVSYKFNAPDIQNRLLNAELNFDGIVINRSNLLAGTYSDVFSLNGGVKDYALRIKVYDNYNYSVVTQVLKLTNPPEISLVSSKYDAELKQIEITYSLNLLSLPQRKANMKISVDNISRTIENVGHGQHTEVFQLSSIKVIPLLLEVSDQWGADTLNSQFVHPYISWKKIENSYDIMGNLTAQSIGTMGDDSRDLIQYFAYDIQGRLDTVFTNASNTGKRQALKYHYNSTDNLVKVEYFSAAGTMESIDYKYDYTDQSVTVKHGLLKEITNNIGTTQTVRFKETLGYYDNGNIKTQGIQYGIGVFTSHTYTYTYDNVNRLTGAQSDVSGDIFNSIYSYNKDGAFTSKTFGGTGIIYEYQASPVPSHRLEKVTVNGGVKTMDYDSKGNLITDGDSGVQLQDYDHRNLPGRMVKGNNIYYYSYNDNGARIIKRENADPGEYYLIDHLGRTLAIYDLSTMVIKSANIYLPAGAGGNGLAGTVEYPTPLTPENSYHIKDHLGTIRITLRETQSGGFEVAGAQDYYPYGEYIPSPLLNGSSQDKYKFTEKERDKETGYDYFGARYYNSRLSLWQSVDPLADKYPGWSPYNYTLCSPIIGIDVDGRWVYIANSGKRGIVPFSNQYENGRKLRFNDLPESWTYAGINDQMNKEYESRLNGFATKFNMIAPKVGYFLENTTIAIGIMEGSLQKIEGRFSGIGGISQFTSNNTRLGMNLAIELFGSESDLQREFFHELIHQMNYKNGEYEVYAAIYASGLEGRKYVFDKMHRITKGWSKDKIAKYFDKENNFINKEREEEFYDELKQTGNRIIK